MTDHIWSQEQIASYLTGGLGIEERERLDRHAKECPECAAALAAAIHFDRGLGTLFLPMRPKPGLEDRAVQATRIAPKPHAILILGWPRRITAAAAAIVILATFGALAAAIVGDGLPFPGEERKSARIQREAESDGLVALSPPAREGFLAPDLTNEDPGMNSNLEASVDLDRLSTKLNKIIKDGEVTAGEQHANIQALTDEAKKLRDRGLRLDNNSAYPPDGNTANNFRSYSNNGTINNNTFGNGGFAGGGGGIVGKGGPGQGQFGNLGGQFGLSGGTPTDQRGNQLFSFYSGYEGNTAPMMALPQIQPGSGPVPVNPTTPTAGPVVPVVTGSGNTTRYFVPTDLSFKATEYATKDKGDNGKGDLKEGLKDGPALPKPSNGEQKLPPPPPASTLPGVPDAAPAVVPEPTRRVVLRSGDIEFEIESFDSGLATVTQLVTKIKGGFVGTVNSEKLANGKVKGSITIRTPPESLDALVLDLRKELGKGGELKSVRLVSQDVTKQFTDTESRLKAARAMETRLLKMIQDGKGEIKQLLEAERELGLWRTKIEESEGELRYFASHAALSTLTITLMEKEIRAAAEVTENEIVQAGVEVEDVDKSYQTVLKEVLDAKGRVLKSELKQLTAGQFNAMLNFEVAPDAGGPIRDRLRQLGRVARLEIDRQQHAEGTMPKNAPIKRGDTVFKVQLYNLANIAPRETATLSVAVADVPASYNTIRDAIAKAAGRVQVAQLNENDKQNVTAQLDFDIKRTDEGGIRATIAAAGESTSRVVSRAAESDQTTDTKILYKITLSPASRLRARDAIGLQIAANDVTATYTNVREAVLAAKGRILASNLNENDKQNVNAALDFEIRRTEEPALKGALDAAGELLSRQIAHASENEAATDAKILYNVRLQPANRLTPRETTVLGLEVQDVDQAVQNFTAQFNEVKGRQIDAKSGRERNGKATARLVYEVPLATASGLVERFKGAGTVRALNTARDAQAPDGKSATARIEITLENSESVVGPDDSVWPPVKKGLSYSFSVLLTSLTWVVFGLCVVLPWALLGYGGYRVVKRVSRSATPPAPPAPPAPLTPHEPTVS